MENVNLYLRPRSKRSVYLRRRSLAVFVCFLGLVSATVLLSAWRVAHADGPGINPPSTASSSASPLTPPPNASSTGVYLGCQELEPVSELPRSSR